MRRRGGRVIAFRKVPRRTQGRSKDSTWRGAFMFMRLRLALIVLATMFALWWLGDRGRDRFSGAQDVSVSFPFCSEPGFAPNCVVDGDTIHIGARRVRLTGFDAPEIDGACLAENQTAQAAKAELARWLSLGAFQLDGGDNPHLDQYGRELRAARRLSPSGELQLLSDHMIAAGLAEGDFWGAGWSDDWGVGNVDWCA